MNSNSKKELAITACKVRMGVIEGTHCAKSGHPGGSLSVTDILTYLYFQEMKTDPQNPAWQERDRLVLSKGHTAPALYAVLAQKGFFPVEELKTLRKIGSRLQGHPDMKKIPGVDMSSGSLGQPTAIIAKTVKGKGVSFMENQASWHGTAPNDEQYRQAMEELGQQLAALDC